MSLTVRRGEKVEVSINGFFVSEAEALIVVAAAALQKDLVLPATTLKTYLVFAVETFYPIPKRFCRLERRR